MLNTNGGAFFPIVEATKRARPIYILDTDQGAISRFPPHPEKESSYGLGVRVTFEKDAVVLEYSQGHFDPAFFA